jgi:16S rRNA C967 or C1407 C5-methylase (RsmB/RsmF family)
MNSVSEKLALADLYLENAPPEFLAFKLVEQALKDVPREEATAIFQELTSHLSSPEVKIALSEQCRSHLVEIFSEEELEILAKFHSEANRLGLWVKLDEYGKKVTPLLELAIAQVS